MEVRIRIIDTLEDDHEYTLEKAEGGSIIVDWKGSDRKDDLNIVGSTLAVTMAKLSREDGAYYDLFTGDETRYRVIMDLADESYTIWQGFLLPDSYSEPYSNSPILVDVVATDGLGRLKGKFLPEDFYSDEKSVIAIIAECLKLTGVGLDFRFAPAIENSQNKDYNTIYINTSEYMDNDKRQDAYAIFEKLISDMGCVVYQANNYYNIEGLNIREQRVYDTKIYSSEGEFIEGQEITRLRKDVTGTGKPDITMQPPVGFLEVEKEKELFGLPEGLSSEENDGWSYVNEGKITEDSTTTEETESLIFASDWFGSDGFFAYSGINNDVFFGSYSASYPQGGQRLDLNYRPYIRAGRKYKLKFSFEIEPASDEEEVNQARINAGDWKNPFNYDVAYFAYEPDEFIRIRGNGIASSNTKYLPLNFGLNDNLEATIELDFIPERSGDFIFTIEPLQAGRGIDKVYINELTLELINESEEIVISGEVAEDWTTTKLIDLEYGSDVNGQGKSFRLQKLKEPYDSNRIDIPVIRVVEYKGRKFISVPLYGANLIDENRGSLENDILGNPANVEVINVFYNYNNSDEHFIEIPFNTVIVDLSIEVFALGKPLEKREYWGQWTDSIYKVERNTYEQSVFNLHKRLLDVELPSMLNLTAKNNIKFDDIIGFDWKDTKEWVITNCKWDVDKGFSDVSITERYYASKGNYPPVVEAGETHFINGEVANLVAEAHDPDGFIATYFWEEVTTTGSNINAPNAQATIVYLPPGVYYARFKVTVTDNDGNTASDEVDVYKRNDSEISLELVSESSGDNIIEQTYRINFEPSIRPDTAVNIRGKLVSDIFTDLGQGEYDIDIITEASLLQDDALISYLYHHADSDGEEGSEKVYDVNKFKYFSANYIDGDDILFNLKFTLIGKGTNIVNIRIATEIENAIYYEGFGNITGTPLEANITLEF